MFYLFGTCDLDTCPTDHTFPEANIITYIHVLDTIILRSRVCGLLPLIFRWFIAFNFQMVYCLKFLDGLLPLIFRLFCSSVLSVKLPLGVRFIRYSSVGYTFDVRSVRYVSVSRTFNVRCVSVRHSLHVR